MRVYAQQTVKADSYVPSCSSSLTTDLLYCLGAQRAEVDVDYTDSIHLSLATSLVINFPQPRFAILPVALGVELVGFGGTVSLIVGFWSKEES